MQLDPNHLAALSAVLRLGSFEGAAAQLCVTPSAISQRIRALEERTGAALILRGTPCTGTPTGVRLAKHAEDISLLETQLRRELVLAPDSNPTRLKVAVNADSLATWLIPALAAVPDLLFDLVIDDQDHSADWLKRGDVSAAVCASGGAIPGCDRADLGALPYVATASPAYVDHWFPDGITRDALTRAPVLVFNSKDMLQKRWLDTHFGGRLAPPCHFLPATHAFVDAALAGLGWGMNPRSLVQEHLDQERLVPLLPGPDLTTPLCWQVSRVLAPALKPLTAAILNAAGEGLQQV